MNTKRRHTARKTKSTKAKKPKFLSLRLQFPADENKQTKQSGMRHGADEAEASTADTTAQQLDLFPIQPENQTEERESNDHENVAFYFSTTDSGATTLTGLLDTSAAAESNSSHTNNNNSRMNYLPPPSPASLTQSYGVERAALVRNALRSRDRDSSEDKWVCYSEVVKEEEVSSSSAVDPPKREEIRRVSLKLDYEEIMNAWSNKGPLYIDAADNSQIVPDINQQYFFSQEQSNQGLKCNEGSWSVPEMVGDLENVEMRMERNGEDELKKGQREASVLRYKEKRQNRLFSRKIRYEVRKLNAEKRPRLKGRFVKRS